MTWNYKCNKCGATLDAGERCTCEKEIPEENEGRQQAHEEKLTSKTSALPVMR